MPTQQIEIAEDEYGYSLIFTDFDCNFTHAVANVTEDAYDSLKRHFISKYDIDPAEFAVAVGKAKRKRITKEKIQKKITTALSDFKYNKRVNAKEITDELMQFVFELFEYEIVGFNCAESKFKAKQEAAKRKAKNERRKQNRNSN